MTMVKFEHGLRATTIHVVITLLVLLALLIWIRHAWYMPLLFTSNGGWHGMAIIAVVALVSGPLLTYIVVNPDKARHLVVFDLACIAVIQILALAYGMHTVYKTRPAVMSYWEGTVYPVPAMVLAQQDVTVADVADLDDHQPPLVYVRNPQNREERQAMVDYGFRDGLSEPALAFLYEPFDQHIDEVFAESVEKRRRVRPLWIEMRERYLENHADAAQYAFIPFNGRAGDNLLIFNRSGDLVDAMPLPE